MVAATGAVRPERGETARMGTPSGCTRRRSRLLWSNGIGLGTGWRNWLVDRPRRCATDRLTVVDSMLLRSLRSTRSEWDAPTSTMWWRISSSGNPTPTMTWRSSPSGSRTCQGPDLASSGRFIRSCLTPTGHSIPHRQSRRSATRDRRQRTHSSSSTAPTYTFVVYGTDPSTGSSV